MGVPKFYRWISERYPKINQVVTDSALLPEFDHLYLDMNGIIHGCTHPNHLDVSDVLSERDMMLGIMHYLDRIITQIVKPKVSVFMAIDGVAPRAKLNQQRSRRFRSAKDMAEATKDMPIDKERGSVHVFDSNCITPGTDFMATVSDTIKYFIRKKLKEDPLWRNLKVIFSGHEVPGEGEHKIMQHIRELKNSPGYQPNTRHVMYGQDADLIMLGLVSHEPHFTLLREIVKFGFGFDNNKNALKVVSRFTKESDFQLLHLSVLREYLEIEFCRDDPERWDVERVVDDFVFLTFLVGNDFLPHMPTLDIGDGAFDLLFNTYKEQRVGWKGSDGKQGYMTFQGEICDAYRLESYIKIIGSVETEILEKKEEDDAVYLKKKRRWNKRDGLDQGPSDAELAATEKSKNQDYMGMIDGILSKHGEADFVDGWTPPVAGGSKDFKGRYYYEKVFFTPLDKEKHKDLRKAYIEGLMWCLAYYYRGCISWGWFFPYHYGPMLSDLIGLPQMFAEIKFELGDPLLPFEQLMGCLPPASSALVPKPYRFLMTSPQSPIIGFYPQDFEVDMNGKKNPWEGVNILPFIDVNLLKGTINKHCPPKTLTPVEQRRNAVGNVYLYTFDLTATESIPSPNRKIGLLDIQNCNSTVTLFEQPETLDIVFKPELVPGTQIPYPGFPSLKVLPILNVELTPVGLNCFGSPSKYPNTILTLHKMPPLPPVEQLAEGILGKSLYINWPMMHEARVVAITDAKTEIRMEKKKKVVKKFTARQQQDWEQNSAAIVQKYLNGSGNVGDGGVQIGEIQYRLKLLPLQGMRTNPSNGSTKKIFGSEEADVPLQLALWQAPAPDPRFEERGPTSVQDRFPAESKVVLTKGKYRGCKAVVVGAVDNKKIGVKVQVMEPEPPFGLAISRSIQESFVGSNDASKLVKLHPNLFGKIMGSLLVEPGRFDLGLNLKYSEGLCVVGYTRKRPDGNSKRGPKKAWGAGDSLLVVGSARKGGDGDERTEKIAWEYTPRAMRIVSLYRQKFPQLFAALSKHPNERKYDATRMFGRQGPEMLKEIREWLNNIESAKLPRSPVTTEALPVEAIQAMQKAADVRTAALKSGEAPGESLVKVPAAALYRESSTSATDILQASDWNDDEAPELGDRVVNLCANGIPFGARGTIVGIHDPASGCVEVVMDEEFVGGGTLQGACSNFRGKLCVYAHLLKIVPENSKALVDKLVPKGSGKAAVDRIIATIEKQAGGKPSEATKGPAWGGAGVVPAKEEVATSVSPKRTPAATPSAKTPPRSSSRRGGNTPSNNRQGSTGRGKQGAWKQARKPDEKGIGFKGALKRNINAKSGFEQWKKVTKEGATTINANKSADLKALLGVSSMSAPPQPPQPPSDASAGLKAMLGVRSAPVPQQPPMPQMMSPPPHPHMSPLMHPPPYPMPVMPHPSMAMGFPQSPPMNSVPTAADKLLQMMQSGGGGGGGPNIMTPPMPAPQFNFTYVEEGKEAPRQQHQQQPQMFHHQPQPPPPPHMMMMAPPPMMGGMHVPMPPPPPQPKFDPPEDEFPALGATPNKKKEEPVVETTPVPKKPTQAPQPIIPSVVVKQK